VTGTVHPERGGATIASAEQHHETLLVEGALHQDRFVLCACTADHLDL
jgi:hypothetical protein